MGHEDLNVIDWIDLTGSNLREWCNVAKYFVFLKDHGIEINDENLFDKWVISRNFSQNLESTQTKTQLLVIPNNAYRGTIRRITEGG